MSETLGTSMGAGPAEGRNGAFVGITFEPSKNDKITDFTSPGTFTPDPSNPAGDVEIVMWGGGGSGGQGIAGVCYGGGGASGTANEGSVISTQMSSPQSVTIGGGGSTTSIGPLSEGGGGSTSNSCNGGNNGDFSGGNGPGPGATAGGGAGSTANGYPANHPSDQGKGGNGFNIGSTWGINSGPATNYIFAGGGGSMRGPIDAGTGANTGSGGNGGAQGGGNSGWPGRVVVKESGAGPLDNTSAVWPLQAQYTYKKTGNWSS